MTHQEEDRIENFKNFIKNGKRIFDQLFNYYKNEDILEAEDIVNFKDAIIKLVYLYKPYLLELTYNEQLNLGQIIVYESEEGTHFLPEPKFKIKETSKIYFDNINNIFINNTQIAHQMPSRAAEDIIREVSK